MKKFFIGRFVIETKTPLAIHSGERDIGRDTEIAKDWNNLPYLPATSIAGVWRSILKNSGRYSDKVINDWFGSCDNGSSCASRFVVTDGLLLDCKSQLHFGLIDPQNDSFYSFFEEVHRERTAINSRGAAKNEAKFDSSNLPIGLRFSFDVEAVFEDDAENDLKNFIQIFADFGFTLGSNTSNGFGAFDIIGFRHMCFDLSRIEDYQEQLVEFRKNIDPLKNIEKDYIRYSIHESECLTELVNMELQALDTWKIGSQERKVANKKVSGSYSEKALVWDQSNRFDSLRERVVIMGSTIKGIFLHRTLYHYLKLKGIYAEDVFAETANEFCFDLIGDFQTKQEEQSEGKRDDLGRLAAFVDLFGYVNIKGGTSRARASNLVVPDVYIDVRDTNEIQRTHNKIDVFSGGTMDTALFTEIRLKKPKFNVKIYLNKNYNFLDQEIKEALKRTICDLAEGYLPVSTGSGRQAGMTKSTGNYTVPGVLN